jgi:hypothetical protein
MKIAAVTAEAPETTLVKGTAAAAAADDVSDEGIKPAGLFPAAHV